MQRIPIHHQHPNPRNIKLAVERLKAGDVIAYPTDTVYGLGCDLENKKALERLYALKELPKNHPPTFLCADLSEVSRYALISNTAFRLMKRILPGPYTVVLEAAHGVPHMLLNKRRTIGIRIPAHEVTTALVRELGHPVLSTSATDPEDASLGDPDEVETHYGRGLSVFLDAGPLNAEESTVISLVGEPELIRQGRGSTSHLF